MSDFLSAVSEIATNGSAYRNAAIAAVILLLASLGELVAEKAGSINISLEGMMLGGAFAAAIGQDLTGSVWVGYNFSGGKKLTWELTPIVGGVFGDTAGVAPGFKGSLNWWKLELYGEGEYVFDLGDSSDSFAYEWSEFTLAPAEWWRFGLVTQRTRAYKSDRSIQRGVLAGVSMKHVTLTAYFFNPDEDKPSFVFAVALPF